MQRLLYLATAFVPARLRTRLRAGSKRRPAAAPWSEVQFENAKLYRWLRFSLPRSSQAKIGKVEFYAGERLLAGEGKGVLFHPFVEGEDAVDELAIGFDVFDSATANRPS